MGVAKEPGAEQGAYAVSGAEGAATTATPATTSPSLFRFATAGSVDDGKSTLVGRLLHDSKAVLVDQLEAIARASSERGFGGEAGGLDLALLTDGLRAEREQGITIDVAYRYFSTGARSFILADCPGHVQYTKNMVTGAATADAVVILIDARKGVLEQTRRHLSVVSLLRVPNVIVAVNKIDLVDYSAAVFSGISRDLRALTAGYRMNDVHLIPVSALAGDNVVTRSPMTPWYSGPTLIELLEALPSIDQLESSAAKFRLDVQLVLRPQGNLTPGLDADEFRDYRAFAGQISSGQVCVGDPVEIQPGNLRSRVAAIDLAGVALESAAAPQSVALRLVDQVDAARGATIAAVDSLAQPTTLVEAELFWLDERPAEAGMRVLVKTGTTTTQALITSVLGTRNLQTLAIEPADRIAVNEIAHAVLRLANPVPIADYRHNRRAGAFLIINPHDGATLAAGIHTNLEFVNYAI